jgi:acetyltransferase
VFESFFNPRSIAVIGASSKSESVGYGVMKGLLQGFVLNSGYGRPFNGKIFPVNPFLERVMGLDCFNSVSDIKESVDLAVVCVPAAIVPSVLAQCGKKKIKNVVIISAGFSEVGIKGKELQDKIIGIALKYKINLLGPNCLGFLRPSTGLNVSFALTIPSSGSIAFVTQSGALADSVIDWAVKERYSFSTIVSVGNSAILDVSDFIEWAGEDSFTKVITVYVEGVNNGKKFMDVLSRVSKKKPVIILKGGKTKKGSKAAGSHTASLVGNANVFEAAVLQSGGIFVDTIEELFDFAKVLSEQPMLEGNAVAVISNSGAGGVLCADYCERYNLNMVELKKETIKKLDSTRLMSPVYSRSNPLDIVGDALPKTYEAAINVLLEEDYIKGLFVIQTIQTMTQPVSDAEIVVKAFKKFGKPMICVFMGGKFSSKAVNILQNGNIPDFNDVKKAVKAMALLAGYYNKKNQE